MDIKKLKEKLNKKVHPAWLWALSIVMGLFSFVSFNVLFEPGFIPAPIIDISKKVVGTILGDQDVDVVTNDDDQNNVIKNNADQNNSVDTSDWKIYENKDLGFSIKYPSDWIEYKTVDNSVLFSPISKTSELKEAEEKSTDSGYPYTFGKVISVDKEYFDNKNIKEIANSLLSLDSEGYVKEFKSNLGLDGFYVYDKGPNRYGGGIGEYYIFLLDNSIYKISFDHEMLSEKVDENLSSIVKNFALNFKKY